MVTGEPSKRSGLSFIQLERVIIVYGIKHGEILKQQANHIKLFGLWLEGEWHEVSKIGSTQPDRQAVDGLGLSFENELLAARQRRVANLTLGHEQAVVFNAQQSNPRRPPRTLEFPPESRNYLWS